MMLDDPRQMANAIRFLAIDAIERAGSGHPGAPLGCAEMATALFTRHLRFNPADPRWFDRDRFVMSNGHGSMLPYSLLHLTGYARISLDEIRNFRTLGSHCPGHPERDPDSGIEVTTGALGQGIANAAGMAVAEAFLRTWLGEDIVDHRTYAIVGDGCLQEGVGQEIISLAGHLRLGHLTFLWDNNRITDDGSIDFSLSDDIAARFRVSGWHVQEVDGHDVEAVSAALSLARRDPRPSLIACRTTIGRGLRVQGERAAHAGRIFSEDSAAARINLGWPHAPFVIPPDIRAAWNAAGERGKPDYGAWQSRVAAMGVEQRQLLDRLRAGRLPEGWERPLRAWRKEAAAKGLTQGGINSSADIVEQMAEVIPELISGSADLEGATQHKRRLADFTANDQGGRYLHYGVREHAMGSMVNGMAAHGGVVPLGVTYLVFSDYQRAALRTAALMGVPSLFVFSDDSIGVGRNGPTHHPVEHLATLRALPNMLVFRPADAVEAAECWEVALAHRGGPCSLVFARQPLPSVRTVAGEENRSARGAYVLTEAEGGARRVTLLATGSEVALALAARATLQAEGVPTAVVSMPCWELFETQDEAYRAAVNPRGSVRVAVEAAVRQGWDRWIGEDGGFVGMSSFGASGPEAELFVHFGITPERIAAEVHRRL